MAISRTNPTYIDKAEFQADTESDISSLPTNCCVGSTCLVVSTGEVYVLNTLKQWKKLGGGE